MSGIFWRHSDPRGSLLTAVVEAIGRSARQDWEQEASSLSKGSRVADLRMLALASAFLQARLSKVREVYSDDGQTVRIPAPQGFSSKERQRAAATLSNVWASLSPLSGPLRVPSFATHGDGGVDPVQEAGNPLLIGVAIVATAAGLFYVGHEVIAQAVQTAGDIVDRQLARKENHRELMKTNALVAKTLAMHSKKEESAGKELPFTEAERLQLQALSSQSDALISKKVADAYNALPDRRSADGWDGWKAGALVVGGLVAVSLLKGKS